MDVEIGSRSETLDEGDRAGRGFGALESRLLDQKCRNDPVDDLQYRRGNRGCEANSKRSGIDRREVVAVLRARSTSSQVRGSAPISSPALNRANAAAPAGVEAMSSTAYSLTSFGWWQMRIAICRRFWFRQMLEWHPDPPPLLLPQRRRIDCQVKERKLRR